MADSPKFYEKFTQKKISDSDERSSKKARKKSDARGRGKNSGRDFLTRENANFAKDENFAARAGVKFANYPNFEKKANRENSKNEFSFEGSLFSSEKIPTDAKKILEDFDRIIQSVRPLNSRQIQQLPDNIKNLSHQLTDKRCERRLGYLNDSAQLSAYARYYAWWNLVRLTKLFANLPRESFPQNDAICLDVGAGPFTVVIALWLARPELRKLKLVWYCLDVSSNSMIFGEDLYLSIAAKTPQEEAWKIIRVKGALGAQIKQKADFLTCANMLNESDQTAQMPPEYQSKKYFQQFKAYAAPGAKWLFVEPGTPKAARTLSLLRMRFLDDGKKISAPCPHGCDCPMNGFKAYTGSSHKWCNFAFFTDDAPTKLQKLSENAKLPKERATLSFLSAISPSEQNQEKSRENLRNDSRAAKIENGKTFENQNDEKNVLCRIVSDEFTVGGKKSYYACSEFGLTLLKLSERAKSERAFASGDLINVKIGAPNSLEKDEKSGAIIMDL